jgi:cytochrome c
MVHKKRCFVKVLKALCIAFVGLFCATSITLSQVVSTKQGNRVDIQEKMKQSKDMVINAEKYMQSNSVEKSCTEFSQNPAWRKGEIHVCVMDSRGIILVDGDNINAIWKSMPEYKSKSLFDKMLERSIEGNWINYEWYGGWKQAYIKRVSKNGTFYIIGAGFFPESQEHTVEQLTNGAVNSFYAQGQAATWASISNPFGAYVRGDIYMFAYDFNGLCVAHGENPALVGQNLKNLRDSQGRLLIQEIIKVAQSPEGKGWVEYEWVNARKLSYVRRVTHPETQKSYAISAGYYPDITQRTVIGLVKRATRYLQSAGRTKAFAQFASADPSSEFNYGPLKLFVYNMEGEVFVDAENPGFVGQNLMNRTDADGRFVTRLIIDQIKKYGSGWISFVTRNAYQLAYVERVETSEGDFIIGSGFFPSSKEQTVSSLVQRGKIHLDDTNPYKAFSDFSSPDGEFFRGDVSLFVYRPNGTCLVNGMNKTVIWSNFLQATDATGKTIVDDLIAQAQAGGGWLSYSVRNAQRRVFVEAVDKEVKGDKGKIRKERYIIGSGYFL